MNPPLKKIALIGPESTGKTTLCKQLAEYFKTSWVPEFARDYVGALDRKYNLDDVVFCAKEQIKAEIKQSENSLHFLFCDTEMITAKVWCADVFAIVPPAIEEMIKSNRYDLFLLTFPDLPFKEDPVRENPHRREYFFNWYKREIQNYVFPFEIIRGVGKERVQEAILSIERYFSTEKKFI